MKCQLTHEVIIGRIYHSHVHSGLVSKIYITKVTTQNIQFQYYSPIPWSISHHKPNISILCLLHIFISECTVAMLTNCTECTLIVDSNRSGNSRRQKNFQKEFYDLFSTESDVMCNSHIGISPHKNFIEQQA